MGVSVNSLISLDLEVGFYIISYVHAYLTLIE